MSARAQAYANENRQIEQSQQRALAARAVESSRPRNALELMANRVNLDPQKLQNTLAKTVFSACKSEEEFLALIIVANEYGLNPLTKEIYAFPAKGGGIVPMVSVDGWIRIMNEHPQFDGIEFDHIVDGKGNLTAIEGIIHRKDRTKPIKVMEYLEECRRGTEPWKQMPNRMLRNRALIQTARIAFGFSGLSTEGDEEFIDITPQQEGRPALPSNRAFADQDQIKDTRSNDEYLGDSIPDFDRETGEVIERDSRGMSEVDEETARALDASGDEREEQGENEAQQPQPSEDETPAWVKFRDEVEQLAAKATTVAQLKKADDRFQQIAAGLPEQEAKTLDGMLKTRRKALSDKQ